MQGINGAIRLGALASTKKRAASNLQLPFAELSPT
jgi:hypothetical protein